MDTHDDAYTKKGKEHVYRLKLGRYRYLATGKVIIVARQKFVFVTSAATERLQ